MNDKEIENEKNNLAASYQTAIINTLIDRIVICINETKIKNITISGGVASNKYLRTKISQLEYDHQISIFYPPIKYCTDNAAMIGIAGYQKYINGNFSNLQLIPEPNLSL